MFDTKKIGLLVATVGLVVIVPLATRGDAGQRRPTPTIEVRVRLGDTLWAIAGRIPGVEDRREAVHRIKELNGLGGESLQIGQRLLIPAPR